MQTATILVGFLGTYLMAQGKAGYSLTELIVAVLFVGILAALAVPRMNLAVVSKHKAGAEARRIVTDLRRTRTLAISDAANNTAGYELKMIGAEPHTSYEIENLDTAATVESLTIDAAASCTGGTSFQFGPLGNLLVGSDTQLTVTAEDKIFTISVISATGAIKCTEN